MIRIKFILAFIFIGVPTLAFLTAMMFVENLREVWAEAMSADPCDDPANCPHCGNPWADCECSGGSDGT